MSDFALSGDGGRHGSRLLWIAEPLRRLLRDLFDRYRPERHYMRGPGPKWREKHAPQQQARDPASPDLAGIYEPR